MPDFIDWPQTNPPRRRRRLFLIVVAIVACIVFGSRTAFSYWVDLLWFRSLGYAEVYWKTLSLQWGIFTAFAAATFVILYGAFSALKRAHHGDLPSGHTIFINGRPVRLTVEPVMRFAAFGVSLVVAGATGAEMMAEWPTLALLWFAPRATGGVVDPIFGKPLNFFLFTLPAWQLIDRLVALVGRNYVRVGRLLPAHHGRNPCAHQEPQQLWPITMARTLHHDCVPVADARDACLYRTFRTITR